MDIHYYSQEETEAAEFRQRLQLHRSTAVPSMVGWIPFGLALILSVVTWQSWHVLYPGFARLQTLATDDLLHPQAAVLETEYFHEDPSSSTALAQDQPVLSTVFTPQVLHWNDQIVAWADHFELDPNVVAVVMQIESCGYSNARSSAGALGLFQVMPYHFTGQQDPFEPGTNAETGLTYLARSQALANGEIERTLAGYNGGHGVINLPSSEWAAETRRYVTWGSGILNDIEAGLETSPTLEAWLAAGGSALCSQASSALQSSSALP